MTSSMRNALWLAGLGGASAALFAVGFARSLRDEREPSNVLASLVCLLVAVMLGKLARTMLRLARAERELERLYEHARTEGVLAEIRALHTSHRLRELEAIEEDEVLEAPPPPRLVENA
jgi:hypothetical protein